MRRHASPGPDREPIHLRCRRTELDRLAGLLGDVRADSPSQAPGAPAALVMRGEAGQGKTVLLDWVADEARSRGCAVLRVTGVEFERGLAFSGLTAVRRPLLPRLDQLTVTQGAALPNALGLAACPKEQQRPRR